MDWDGLLLLLEMVCNQGERVLQSSQCVQSLYLSMIRTACSLQILCSVTIYGKALVLVIYSHLPVIFSETVVEA